MKPREKAPGVVQHGSPLQGFTREAGRTKVGSALELTDTELEVIASPVDG